MLIESPRHTPADLAAWRELERYDRVLAKSRALQRKTERARATISDFAAVGACYVSTSWGKDSTVIAHLAATSGIVLPLVYVRVDPWDNPDCLLVRDEFLARWGSHVAYEEIVIDGSNSLRWWHENSAGKTKHAPDPGFKLAEKAYGGRHISGVRGEESRIRDMVMGRWGEAGPHACRPIGRWSAVDVFAYLSRHDLPIHPAYAMSIGGALDRRWLRVSTIGGVRGADKQRANWEALYYSDVMQPAKEQG